MKRTPEELGRIRNLHNLTGIHQGYTLSHALHHGQIMRDEHERHATLPLQLL
jgi:hypothetical protein